MSCYAAPCHAEGNVVAPPDDPLVLQDDADLYVHMTSYVSKACGNIKLIDPGNPDGSALVKILQGPCGDTPRMPRECSDDACIPAEYIDAISRWISAGAPEQ